jgi:hypothetical protein
MAEEVTVEAAREFLTPYVPDADAFASMADDKVLEYHASLTENMNNYANENYDWRGSFVKGMELDEEGMEKENVRLARFQQPSDVYKSFREAEAKISKGIQTPLPDGATEEDIKAYREANNIPATGEDYFEGLPKDLILTGDVGMFEDFSEHVLQANNLPASALQGAAEWYYAMQESSAQLMEEGDIDHKDEAEDQLRIDWGKDYRINHNVIGNFLSKVPEALREDLTNARLPDGRGLFNSPDFLKHIVDIERQINPASALTPGGADSAETNDARIGEIEQMMRNNRKAYNKDTKVQEEYRQRLDIRTKMSSSV